MTGQCEFHPFDQAVDVCGECYADICEACVTSVRSRPDIICRDCTITLSGVRGSSKVPIRGDKSTVKARREALRPEVATPETPEADDTEWIRDEAGSGIRGKLSSMAAGFLPGSGSRPSSGTPDNGLAGQLGRSKKRSPQAGYAENSAVNQLDRLRTEDGSSNVASTDIEERRSLENKQIIDDGTSRRAAAPEPANGGSDGGWPTLDGDPAATPQPAIDDQQPTPAPQVQAPAPVAASNQPQPEPIPSVPEPDNDVDWEQVSAPDLSQDPFAAR